MDFWQPGTPISFLDRLRIEDGYLSAQLDNVLSVALLIHLFRNGFQGTALFTAQEEAGRSWRYALAWFQSHQLWTDRLLVLDTSPYPTRSAADAQEVVLRHKDSNGAFAIGLTHELAERCKLFGIRYSFKDEIVEMLNTHEPSHYRWVGLNWDGWWPRQRERSAVPLCKYPRPDIIQLARRLLFSRYQPHCDCSLVLDRHERPTQACDTISSGENSLGDFVLGLKSVGYRPLAQDLINSACWKSFWQHLP